MISGRLSILFPVLLIEREQILDTFIHSHFVSSESKSTWLKSTTTGANPCGTCLFCVYMSKRTLFINPIDSKSYVIKDFISCKTPEVVYAAQCPCDTIYVGKTIKRLRRRICQHISSINRCVDTPLS